MGKDKVERFNSSSSAHKHLESGGHFIRRAVKHNRTAGINENAALNVGYQKAVRVVSYESDIVGLRNDGHYEKTIRIAIQDHFVHIIHMEALKSEKPDWICRH